MATVIPPDPNKPRPVAEDLDAEVRCDQCGKTRWIDFDYRYRGMQTLPKGVEPSIRARCMSCVGNNDFTRFTGNTRWRR